MPFRHLQGRAKGDVESQCLLGMLRGLWQGLEQRNRGGAVTDGFQMGRAVASVFACPLPVGNRLLGAVRGGVGLGDQFWLRLDGLRELGLQHLGNALVILVTGAPQQ